MNRKMKKVLVHARVYVLFFRALLWAFVPAMVLDHMSYELVGATTQPSMLAVVMAIFAFFVVWGALHVLLCWVATSAKRQRNLFSPSGVEAY